jgi:hypothetical protein
MKSKVVNKMKLKEREVELVLTRLEMLSPKIYFSSGGSTGSISRDEMIQHIQNYDSIGQAFVKTDIEFLRAYKNGELLKKVISAQALQKPS